MLVGRRCAECAVGLDGTRGPKGKRRPPELPDPAELLALAEADPEAALTALEALP